MKTTAPTGSTWALSLPLTEMVADYLEQEGSVRLDGPWAAFCGAERLEFIRFVERTGARGPDR